MLPEKSNHFNKNQYGNDYYKDESIFSFIQYNDFSQDNFYEWIMKLLQEGLIIFAGLCHTVNQLRYIP